MVMDIEVRSLLEACWNTPSWRSYQKSGEAVSLKSGAEKVVMGVKLLAAVLEEVEIRLRKARGR
jgi:hypothetical protein